MIVAPRKVRTLRDPPGHLEAVHVRHLVVEQDQGEGPSALVRDLHRLESRRSAVGRRGPHPPVGEDVLENAAVRRVVVDDEHRHPLEVARLARERLGGERGRHLKGNGEVETASLAGLALHPDPSAHEAHQLGRNGEPEPRPTESPCRGRVSLRERVEDGGLLLRGDADTGIAHREVQRHRRPARSLPIHLEDDLARFRELQGVADQVHNDLAQPPRIATHRRGYVRRHVIGQLDALLMGARGEGAHRLVQGVAQVEVHPLQVQLARLDLGEVQDVVDQRQQRVRGKLHRVEVLLLLGRQRRAQRQLGHPDDPVQRRPEFVAHVREELALSAVGRFRGGASLDNSSEDRGHGEADSAGDDHHSERAPQGLAYLHSEKLRGADSRLRRRRRSRR